MAKYFFVRAEDEAGLAQLDQGAFHPYRRLWASERKHLSDVDVARAGGWRNTVVMKRAYQQADPQTVLSMVENAPAGHNVDTDDSQAPSAQSLR